MRALMLALITTLAACVTPATEAPVLSRVDHIIYAVEDLDQGVADIEARLGVRAVRGGAHPGLGTHNALLSLGPHTYLEIIAPDPAQPAPEQLPLGMSNLTGPKLIGWAANAPSLEALTRDAAARGYPMFAPEPGQRRTPNGATLTWRSTALEDYNFGNGIVPFFIDWGETPSPATTSPQGARLVALRAEHPNPETIRPALDALGVSLEVSAAAAPALIAIVEGPRGQIELR